MQVLIVIAVLLPFALVVAAGVFIQRHFARDRRRSPLNLTLFHTPGEQLRRKLLKLDEEFQAHLVMLAIAGPIVGVSWLGMKITEIGWSNVSFKYFDLFLLLGLLVVMALWMRKVMLLGKEMRSYREGLAAELAVGQCLMEVAEKGCPVLHDIPADDFNIDHVVIGSHAVFAIETKSRKKPESGGKENARVLFDGKSLRFPLHSETKPLDQSRANARWLAIYLNGELGAPVRVVPVLALPGWFIEYSKEGAHSDVLVHNCKVPSFATWDRYGEPIGDKLKGRIRFSLCKRYEIEENRMRPK